MQIINNYYLKKLLLIYINMSFNGNLTVPDSAFICADKKVAVLNIGKPTQVVNINGDVINLDGSVNFINTINNVNINNLTVRNISSFSSYDESLNINGRAINIGTTDFSNNIIIGNDLSKVTVYGSSTYIYTNIIQQTLNSPILEINRSWNDTSSNIIRFGGNAGIQIDSAGLGPGYIITNTTATNFLLKAPQSTTYGIIATTDLNNNMTITGKLTLGNTINVEQVLNTKVDNSTSNLINYYTKQNIDSMQLLSLQTALSIFVTITDKSNVTSLTVLGDTNLLGPVTTYSQLNILGKANMKDVLVVSGTIYGLGGASIIGNLNATKISVGSISNVETAINSKADITTLSSYLTKTEASQTYATITQVSPLNINGYDLVRFNFTKLISSSTLLGSQWANGFIGLADTNTFTIILPSAYEIINTTLIGIAPAGSCFHTYMSYQLGIGRYDIILKTNNTNNSLTTIYDGYGFSEPQTDQLMIKVQRSYAPVFEPYYTHFITRIDSGTSMSIFKL